jgi:hypothetical protein
VLELRTRRSWAFAFPPFVFIVPITILCDAFGVFSQSLGLPNLVGASPHPVFVVEKGPFTTKDPEDTTSKPHQLRVVFFGIPDWRLET